MERKGKILCISVSAHVRMDWMRTFDVPIWLANRPVTKQYRVSRAN